MKPPTVFLGEMTSPEVEAFLAAGHDRLHHLGVGSEGGRHFGGLEHAGDFEIVGITEDT